MNVKFEQLNGLPTKTWHRMGVNGGDAVFSPSGLAPYWQDPLKTEAPDGLDAVNLMSGLVHFLEDETDPTLHPQALEFVRRNRTAGYFFRVGQGVKLAEPIMLDYRLDEDNPSVVDEHLILAEEDSEITVVMRYGSAPEISGSHCGLTKLIAKNNAVIRLIQVQLLGSSIVHFDHVGVLALEGARVEVLQAELGGKHSYSNCHAQLRGKGSELEVNTVYLGDRNRSIDVNVVAEQFGKRTKSEITARGALMDESRKIFRGTIDFKKGSSGSKGREDEYSLLLGKKVSNRTAPLILCAEEDVEGQHAASTGRVDENRLFYLMSRGLSELEAKKLLIEAEFAPITAKIPVEEIQKQISEHLRARLNSIE